jgi:hypothetical protein
MSVDENPTEQAEADVSPNQESADTEGASNATKPPPTAIPNDRFLAEKLKLQLCVEKLNLEVARKESDNVRRKNTTDRKLANSKETVSSLRIRVAELDAARRALETELKAKLRSAQLAAKDNSNTLLIRGNGWKQELAKAKRDILDLTRSLTKALKGGSALGKQVLALQKANKHFEDELADARLKLKDDDRVIKENKKQLNNQLESKHQHQLSLAKIDLEKHRVSLSREKEKKRKRDDVFQHKLSLIAAREASSKRVKETTASNKTRSKEKALEVSNQRVQTMMDTYNGTHSGQFPNGRTNLENVSSDSNWIFVFSANSPKFFHSLCRLSQTSA